MRESLVRVHGNSREYHLRHRYGIGVKDVEAMRETQGDRCATCAAASPQHVDHDHLSGRVRALLCCSCNGMLGQARDEVDVLRRAADHLETTTPQVRQTGPGTSRIDYPQGWEQEAGAVSAASGTR